MTPRYARTLVAVCAAVLTAAAVSGCAASGGGGQTQTSEAPAQAPLPANAPVGQAKVEGGVQRISVDASQGFWDPTIIQAKAGVPLEIAFGPGQGCMASVLIPDFGIQEDLTQGGATVKLPAMKAGSYSFSCGMQMVFGRIDVQ
jgi:hypothetical protein